ncbi:MAG: HDOD domain-containing protein [Desulfamplus sp.]|nr:HDOD domain-containing protein [Desulfamplus sp.]
MLHFTNQHIPSGSFKTSKQSNVLFKAHLGTCVGIALFDTNVNVGGIIHILLPEPVSSFAPEYPEKYASTGLPLFLQEMYAMGAKPATMAATVAGGALVGPLSHQDINLDIGGRSTDIAMKILRKEGIKIIKSETGGFFTCTLELNLSNGVTTISPAWNYNFSPFIFDKYNDSIKVSIISKENIEYTMESLSPIPQTALKIMRIVQQDNYTIESILKELQKDQVLAARTIKMCNSVIFTGKIKIESLKDALLILGENTLINSVITATIKSYFKQSDFNGYSLCRGGMFFHSVGCAVTSGIIAKITAKTDYKIGYNAELVAYTAGLLHDIGKVVLDQYIANLHPLFCREIYQNKSDYLTTEKDILGITHCETGAMLAKKWCFSDLLIDVIQYHHTPEKSSPQNRHIVSIVHIADLLMSRFNTGFEIDKIKSDNFDQILFEVGLVESDLTKIIDNIPLYVFDLNS